MYRLAPQFIYPMILINVFMASLALAANLAAAADPGEEGFVVLFDGKSTHGWRGYKQQQAPAGWTVEDSTLARTGKGGDIMTDEQFGDFDLRFEWKVAPGANSGVMYRVTEDQPASYMTGPEYQVLDNAKHQDGRSPLTSAAALYGLYAAQGAQTKPVGEYNEARIVVQGNHVEHWLNGKKVVDAEIGSADWNHRVAGSKFNAWKKFGRNARGHIVIQNHGDPVWFRHIRIKKLK